MDDVKDMLGAEGRRRMAFERLALLQAEAYNLVLLMATEGMHEHQPVPGLPAGPDGTPTFAERLRDLDEAQTRVRELMRADNGDH